MDVDIENLVLSVADAVVPLAIITAYGFLLVRLGVMGETDITALNTFNVRVGLPIMFFNAIYQKQLQGEEFKYFSVYTLTSLATFVVVLVISLINNIFARVQSSKPKSWQEELGEINSAQFLIRNEEGKKVAVTEWEYHEQKRQKSCCGKGCKGCNNSDRYRNNVRYYYCNRYRHCRGRTPYKPFRDIITDWVVTSYSNTIFVGQPLITCLMGKEAGDRLPFLGDILFTIVIFPMYIGLITYAEIREEKKRNKAMRSGVGGWGSDSNQWGHSELGTVYLDDWRLDSIAPKAIDVIGDDSGHGGDDGSDGSSQGEPFDLFGTHEEGPRRGSQTLYRFYQEGGKGGLMQEQEQEQEESGRLFGIDEELLKQVDKDINEQEGRRAESCCTRCQRNPAGKIAYKVITIPMLQGILLGLIVSYIPFEVPEMFGTLTQMVANTCTPVGMFAVGMFIAVQLKSLKVVRSLYHVFFKMISAPLLAIGICKMLNMSDYYSRAAVTTMSTTTAAGSFAVLSQYKADPDKSPPAVVSGLIFLFPQQIVIQLLNALLFPNATKEEQLFI